MISGVRVKELSFGTYSEQGKYFGGYVGASLFSWYLEKIDGTIVLIKGATSLTYKVNEADCIILPELPNVEMLALTRKEIEGEVLTAIKVIPKGDHQQFVWNKYIKEVKYQRSSSTEVGDTKSLEVLPTQRSCSYKVHLEDIGH
uniref:Uncharacterized protein n=1 Tax=Cucumis melo TaxID=3656 RepID=A0A9I9CGQ4_CUCME